MNIPLLVVLLRLGPPSDSDFYAKALHNVFADVSGARNFLKSLNFVSSHSPTPIRPPISNRKNSISSRQPKSCW